MIGGGGPIAKSTGSIIASSRFMRLGCTRFCDDLIGITYVLRGSKASDPSGSGFFVIKITAVPTPATLILLESGQIRFVGFRKKLKK